MLKQSRRVLLGPIAPRIDLLTAEISTACTTLCTQRIPFRFLNLYLYFPIPKNSYTIARTQWNGKQKYTSEATAKTFTEELFQGWGWT